MLKPFTILTFLSLTLALCSFSYSDDLSKLPVVFEEDFEKGADRWEPTVKEAWKLTEDGGSQTYDQHKSIKHKTPHRSPYNTSLIKDLNLSSFVITARVRSTKKDYNHRDMCLFFNYQNPAEFYYVHLGKKTDNHANQIFIVNKADRTKISSKTTDGTNWDDEWHDVKIERNAETGSIKIFYDDMKNPIMEATDKTFTTGQIGIGSFDDTGRWDNIVIRGTKAE